MADYFSPTVIQQTIPVANMTPLERLLLTHIFCAEPDGDGLYFYAEEGPADMIVVSRAELVAAFAASPQSGDSTATTYLAERLAQLPADEAEFDLDLSGTSWMSRDEALYPIAGPSFFIPLAEPDVRVSLHPALRGTALAMGGPHIRVRV